jgi:hypothetical protein
MNSVIEYYEQMEKYQDQQLNKKPSKGKFHGLNS